ncbi:hypothetical protein FJZ39_00575 [Candidatus Saccharibacteria bacterium]|nr:hypothetical protein [Candidatus Saccharibacteria bacterium]
MSKNIWLLTEERPKTSVVKTILINFMAEGGMSYSADSMKIVPIMKDGKFTFCYEVLGFNSDSIKRVFVLPVSGKSSFVDFMLFHKDDRPDDKDIPDLIIEETKTDDGESRNTGAYQRASKFVFTEFFYPGVRKLMLYNLQIPQKETPTATSVFGTRMLLTIGVEIVGKKAVDPEIFKPFENIDELMDLKNAMPDPAYGVAVKFTKTDDTIYLSAKLEKSGQLAHDPNIGMTAIMAACLRKLGWKGRIVITKHGLPQSFSVGKRNKFNYIAHMHGIELEGISLPDDIVLPKTYWQKETEKEKTGTIFVHVICENLVNGVSIYENHGGCERGYFLDYSQGKLNPVTIPKYRDRELYKAGDKTYIIYIPDLVLFDKESNQVINIEGKKYSTREKGVEELNNFDFFESEYINTYYKGSSIVRGLVLAGSGNVSQAKQMSELTLYLASDGTIVTGASTPPLILSAVEALKRL